MPVGQNVRPLSRRQISTVLQALHDDPAPPDLVRTALTATASGLAGWCSPIDVELALMFVQGKIPSSGCHTALSC